MNLRGSAPKEFRPDQISAAIRPKSAGVRVGIGVRPKLAGICFASAARQSTPARPVVEYGQAATDCQPDCGRRRRCRGRERWVCSGVGHGASEANSGQHLRCRGREHRVCARGRAVTHELRWVSRAGDHSDALILGTACADRNSVGNRQRSSWQSTAVRPATDWRSDCGRRRP